MRGIAVGKLKDLFLGIDRGLVDAREAAFWAAFPEGLDSTAPGFADSFVAVLAEGLGRLEFDGGTPEIAWPLQLEIQGYPNGEGTLLLGVPASFGGTVRRIVVESVTPVRGGHGGGLWVWDEEAGEETHPRPAARD